MKIIDYATQNVRLPRPQLGHIHLRITETAAALANMGLDISVTADMGMVHLLQQMNKDQGFGPLYPGLHPHFSPRRGGRFFLLARDKTGAIVATAGCVRDHVRVCFRESWKSLALLVEAQVLADMRLRGHQPYAECSAPSANVIKGEIMGLYGVWTHPDRRGQGVAEQMVRLAYAVAYGAWSPGWLVGLVHPNLGHRMTWHNYQFRTIESAVAVHLPDWSASDIRLCSATRADLEEILGIPALYMRGMPKELV